MINKTELSLRFSDLKKRLMSGIYPKAVMFADDQLFELEKHYTETKVTKASETITIEKPGTSLEEDKCAEFQPATDHFTNYIVDTTNPQAFYFANNYFFIKDQETFLYEKNREKHVYSNPYHFSNLAFKKMSPDILKSHNYPFRHAPIKNISHSPKTIISLSNNGNPNYFHWLHFPSLINISTLETYDPDTLKDCAFYLGSYYKNNMRSYMHETLQQMKITPDRLIYENTTGSRMIACFQNMNNITVSPKHLSYIKKLNDNTKNKPSDERIFISRKDAKSRRLVNEDEIFAELSQHGFKRHCLTGMSLQEQISLFTNAKIIIGPHGAGMNNISFCDEKQTLIELFSPNHLGNRFYKISALNHVPYYYAIGEALNENTHVDFKIDINKLKKLLKKVL